jgi:hypothetical protein
MDDAEKILGNELKEAIDKGKKEDVENIVEAGEIYGYEGIITEGKKWLKDAEISESEVSQITNLGGSPDKILEETDAIKTEVEAAVSDAEKGIKEIEDLPTTEEGQEGDASVVGKSEVPTEEVFDSAKMIKEMTGGSEKLERFGRGYDSALNMYTSSLTNPSDLEKYKDIFSQLAPEDKAKIEQGVVSQEIKNTTLNWDVPEVQEKFNTSMENYSKMFPESVANAKTYTTMLVPNFNPAKLQDMYKISASELGGMLRDAKFKMIEDIKKAERAELDKLSKYYNDLIGKTNDSDEKRKFARALEEKSKEILDGSTDISTKSKINKVEKDYEERLAQIKY